MIKPEDMSSNFRHLASAAGWNPSRHVDTARWAAQLTGEGFSPVPLALELLTSLGGLIVKLPPAGLNPYGSELLFDPVRAASGEFDRVADWQDELAIKLFPLADEVKNGIVVWVGSDGKFYFGRECGLYLLGDSFTEAMDQLASATKSATLVVP
jgi:hypothetical protein